MMEPHLGVALALLAAFVVIRIVRWMLDCFEINVKGRYVLVTGCDSGFGRRLCLTLLKRGVHVLAGCYTVPGRVQLEADAPSGPADGELVTFPLDITSDDSVREARRFVEDLLAQRNAKLWAVVNNAGVFTTFGPDDWCTLKEYKQSIDVNTYGAIRVTHAFMPLLKKSCGRVVTMCSSAGRVHGRYLAPYCVAKFALEAYMDCLRIEARAFRVSVHILEPGAFKTELLDQKAMQTRVDRIWGALDEETRVEYGAEFKNRFVRVWGAGVRLIASSNLDWVVGHYMHAICGRFPHRRYQSGWDAVLLLIPLSIAPTWLQDLVLQTLYGLQPGPQLIPDALLHSTKPTKDRLPS